jgi:tripeptide aminopeptidase
MIDADFGYCLDSSGDTGRLIMKGCGENEISITITGRAAHAGIAPEEGINAIVAASRAISTLRDGRLDADTTINVGTITGGTASNIVPDFAEIVIDARSTAKLKLATLTRYISEHFTHHAANNDAQCSVKIESAFKPYELYENDAVVKTALAAFADCKLTPKLTASGGGSDANLLNEKFPCAVLGIGVRHAHTNGEYIDASDLITTKNIILALIKEA